MVGSQGFLVPWAGVFAGWIQVAAATDWGSVPGAAANSPPTEVVCSHSCEPFPPVSRKLNHYQHFLSISETLWRYWLILFCSANSLFDKSLFGLPCSVGSCCQHWNSNFSPEMGMCICNCRTANSNAFSRKWPVIGWGLLSDARFTEAWKQSQVTYCSLSSLQLQYAQCILWNFSPMTPKWNCLPQHVCSEGTWITEPAIAPFPQNMRQVTYFLRPAMLFHVLVRWI